MMRMPWFAWKSPATIAEAAKILAGEGPQAMLIAGGVKDAGTPRLMRWDGRSATAKAVADLPADLKPEGVVRARVGGRDRTLVICDTSRYLLVD